MAPSTNLLASRRPCSGQAAIRASADSFPWEVRIQQRRSSSGWWRNLPEPALASTTLQHRRFGQLGVDTRFRLARAGRPARVALHGHDGDRRDFLALVVIAGRRRANPRLARLGVDTGARLRLAVALAGTRGGGEGQQHGCDQAQLAHEDLPFALSNGAWDILAGSRPVDT